MSKSRFNLSITIFLICAAIVLSATVVFTTTPPSRLVCDIWPPYQMETPDGINGFATEMVKAVYKRLDTPIVSLKSFPWKRALSILESGHADALFSANYTPNRDVYARYSEEKLGSSTRRVEFDFIDYNSDCAIAQDLQWEVTAYECE